MKKTRPIFLVPLLLLLVIGEAAIILFLTTAKKQSSVQTPPAIMRPEGPIDLDDFYAEQNRICPTVISPEKIQDGVKFNLDVGDKTELLLPCGPDNETFRASLEHGIPIMLKSVQVKDDGTVTSAVIKFGKTEQTITTTTKAIYIYPPNPNDPTRKEGAGAYLEVIELRENEVILKGVRVAC